MIQHTTNTIWVGLDVHSASITAAILHDDSPEPEIVRLSGYLNATRKLFRKLAKDGVPRACYEASSAGYVLQRTLDHDGFRCEVIAPSLIPILPGDHRKTDRLDAAHLARMYRSGHLTSVTVPDIDQEAVRHMVRARLFLRRQITRSKHRIMGILRTTDHRFTGSKTYWTKVHRAWLAKLRREMTGPMQIVLASELEMLEYLETSQRSMDTRIGEVAQQKPWREPAEALCCFRGIQALTAMTILTEIGDIKRFKSPRQLMGYTGLVPSERSSGEKQRRGPITRSGNKYLRRVLIESAWHYSKQAGATLKTERRRMGQDPAIVGIATKAQHRLRRRYLHLSKTKNTNKAVTAVAREFVGFIWSMLMEIDRH